jgi:tetratricopeptide (TPR) repeat protein
VTANLPPNSSSASPPTAAGLPLATLDAVVSAFLQAFRAGTLDELLRRRPRATRWFARRLLPPLHAVAGDALPDDPASADAWGLLLRALLAALRPDGGAGLDAIDKADWLDRTSWRPLLALACQHRVIAVASFPEAYRARADEAPADHLCGLWDVAPSTFYRHVDKGRQMLAEAVRDGLARAPLHGERRLARDALLLHEVAGRLGLSDPAALADWHAGQAARALAAHAAWPALWHLAMAGDGAGVVRAVQRFRVELAGAADTDALLQRFGHRPLPTRQRFDLLLAQAGLWRARGVEAAERQAYDDALRLASSADDKLMLGIVYGAMGKFNEARDADRAFACYQDSADFLRQAAESGDASGNDADVLEVTIHTLVKLAWLYVLRNDPRARPLLDRADALRERCPQAVELLAMLEQSWGEFWRRSGELRRAVEHKHRALQIYERLGDRQAILKTYANLGLVYGDAHDFARAIDYSNRVLDLATRFTVEPETVAATHLNLGAAYFWQGKYDRAIEHYTKALAIAQQARLRVLVGRAHYNLAEAYYKRFQALDHVDDERRGDAHTAAALASWPDGGDPAAAEATRALKGEILGPRDGSFVDRLLPGEFAAHFGEMTAVQRHRAALALPLAPADSVASHLAIARAYLEIAVKEREAAVALIHKHGLGDTFAADLAALHDSFEREPSRELHLAGLWREASAGVLPPQRCDELLQHLLQQGSINKSGYAALCGIGGATASKQLVQLAERGLLVQTGKGPSTRYTLAA